MCVYCFLLSVFGLFVFVLLPFFCLLFLFLSGWHCAFANSVSRILALSSHFVRPSIHKCDILTFSTIWAFRPHKPNIFWKLMTPTIHWPTNHSPITLPDPPDPKLTQTNQTFDPLYSVLMLMYMKMYAFWLLSLAVYWHLQIRPDSPVLRDLENHQNHQILKLKCWILTVF